MVHARSVDSLGNTIDLDTIDLDGISDNNQ
jgi:hypothetical protein